MTSGADRWACDTSVAIPAIDPNHEAHAPCRRALIEHRPALAGHAGFEAYAVLTRLPVPRRLTPAQAQQVLTAAFPDGCGLARKDADALWTRLAALGIAGGAVYDALVAQAALADARVLLTRDTRAERIYRAIGVSYEFVS